MNIVTIYAFSYVNLSEIVTILGSWVENSVIEKVFLLPWPHVLKSFKNSVLSAVKAIKIICARRTCALSIMYKICCGHNLKF